MRFVVHGIGAPLFGSTPVRFFANTPIEGCVQRLNAAAAASKSAPNVIVDETSTAISIRYPLWRRIGWQVPIFRGQFVTAEGWTELRGYFVMRSLTRIWFSSLLAVTTFLAVWFATAGQPMPLVIPLVVVIMCELFWWFGDRDRTAIRAFIEGALRSSNDIEANHPDADHWMPTA